MASEVREFTVSIPAGTAIAAPATTALVMPARIVRKIRVRVPKGPSGRMGFALASSGVPIIPWNAGAWIVADDEVIEWELENQITSGAWQLIGYNLGSFAHSVYLVFELDPPGQVASLSAPISPLDLAGLSPGSIIGPSSGGGSGDPGEGQDGIPPDVLPPPAEALDGYAIARQNAIAAVELALGATVDTERIARPAVGTAAAAAYDAGRQAARAAIAAL